jgi:uncharacterized membrane protein YkoI
MKRIAVILAFAALATGIAAQERATTPAKKATPPAKKLEVKDLPAAVQKTVQEQSKGSEIKNIGRETEDGVTQYEVETMLNGKHRDFNVDLKGVLLLVEEETTMDSVPPAARAAILKKAAGGKLGMVELFKKNGATMYEAGYTSKDGKSHTVLLKADGVEVKD